MNRKARNFVVEFVGEGVKDSRLARGGKRRTGLDRDRMKREIRGYR